MTRRLIAGLALAAAATAPLLAQNYGPEPDWDTFRQLGEAAIIERLIDPDSAQIRWLSGIHRGGYKPSFAKKIYGYVGCGSVNARNRLGGFTGRQVFVVVIDIGRVQFSEIGRADGDLAKSCEKAVRLNIFPRAPLNGEPINAAATSQLRAAAGTAASAVAATGSSPTVPIPTAPSPAGITIRAMPEGAYIASVAAGSPAAAAGLTPGMVITSINGIALAGMGEAMTQVVNARGGATLAILGGKTVKLAVGN